MQYVLEFPFMVSEQQAQTSRSEMATSSSSSSSLSLPSNVIFLFSNLSSLITVKLDASNYIIWKKQVLNVLRASRLLKFIDNSQDSPCPEIIDTQGNKIPNPEFLQWEIVDAHLVCFLFATLSPVIFSSVLHLDHTKEIWLSLEKRFTSLSRSHVQQLKIKLQNIKKGAGSIEEYLSEIKTLSDQLALASAKIEDEDLILLTLNGLPDEYNSFKTFTRTRSGAMTMEEFTSLLTAETIHVESAVKKIDSPSTDISMAFNVSRTNENTSNSVFRPSYGYSNNRGRQNFRGNNRGRNFNNGGGRFFNNRNYSNFSQNVNQSTLVCQICGKTNHSAAECFHRHNLSYQTPSYLLSMHHYSGPRALMTVTEKPNNSNWFLDTGATDHVTSDLRNLHLRHPYHGNEQITIANGESLQVRNTGQDNQSYHLPRIAE